MAGQRRVVEPFDIDSDELNGISLQEAFTFGVEWQAFRDKIKSVNDFSAMVHRGNVERIARIAARRGRVFRISFLDETWAEVAVNAICPSEVPEY